MGACKVEVEPGPCKMTTVIVAKPSDDMMSVIFEVQSTCKFVQKMAAAVPSINPYDELNRNFAESEIYKAAAGNLSHLACPVPCAFIKAMEVASEMGLKRDVTLKIEDA